MLIINISNSQDPIFNQFGNNPIYLNPAQISEYHYMTTFLNYRYESTINSNLNTAQFTYTHPYFVKGRKKDKSNHLGSFGFSIYNDIAAQAFKTLGSNLSYAYKWRLDRKFLHNFSFGLSAGFINYSVDMSKLTWGEQFDSFNGFNPDIVATAVPSQPGTTVFDSGFGIHWYLVNPNRAKSGIKSAKAGISIGHLNNPNTSLVKGNETKLPRIFKFNSSFQYALDEKCFVGARSFLMTQNTYKQINAGVIFGINYELDPDYILRLHKYQYGFVMKEVMAILWARNGSLGLTANFDFTNYRIGLSYDGNYSTFSELNMIAPAYEIAFMAVIPDWTGKGLSRPGKRR